MKTAAVVIDRWKLPVFQKHLDATGYEYEQQSGTILGTVILQVKYEWVAKLQPVIEAANKECKK